MTSIEEYFATGRHTSGLVKVLIQNGNITTHIAASTIGAEDDTFRKKLSRGRFSYDEVLLIADRCGFKIGFEPKETPNVT